MVGGCAVLRFQWSDSRWFLFFDMHCRLGCVDVGLGDERTNHQSFLI